MKRIEQFAVCALIALAVFSLSGAASAQAVFSGTWKIDMSRTRFSEKPLTFYTSEGWYHCENCSPPVVVAADGKDHPTQDPAYDTYSVTLVDDHTLHVVAKKGGMPALDITNTVSPDGKTLTSKGTNYPESGGEVTYEMSAKRQGTLPTGVHATSGNWLATKASGSENGLATTYKVNGDEISMTMPTGASYTTKLDGGDSPVKGYTGWDTVSLKKLSDHEIDETDKFGGKVVWTGKMTVAANGKAMTIVGTEEPSGRATTYSATRQ
jgi:hypothetical protein